MKILRYSHETGISHGVLKNDRVHPILGDIFSDFRTEEEKPAAIEHVKILPPVNPTKVIAVGINYRDHAQEFDHHIPEEPVLFMKPPTAVIGPGDAILLPPSSKRVDYEAELAAVVKKEAHKISGGEAEDYILGYTCLNDVTARDLQRKDGQWTRAKSFDTFGVVGPWIETDVGDPNRLAVECRLNGRVRQQSSTEQLAFDCRFLVSWCSRVMTLEPGDVIATGTPAGIGPMQPGDTVEVEVEGVGVLSNPVVAEREKGAKPVRVV
jgi:2-keto-4-pentenoate hydratase/2-oxohepta-3-ene-1,7-dioic acid hydratase in catechol pathway